LKRANFIKELQQYPAEKLIYIDKFISREYEWGTKGAKVIGEVSGRRYTRESFVAQHQKKIIAPFCYKGTCDNVLFNFWLENLDNAAFINLKKLNY
jgi:hypothetical protein